MNKRMTMTYAVAAGVAATLLLAGCNGGDEDPTTTPTPTSSSSGSSTPNASTPTVTATPAPTQSVTTTVPTEAKSHSEAGAVAYAKWYVGVADQSFVMLDAGPIRSGAKADCLRCVAMALGVEEAAKQKARQKSLAITIDNAFAAEPPEPDPDQYFVDVQTNERAVDVVKPDGTVASKTTAGKRTWRMNVDWANGSWLISTLEVL